MKSIGILPMFLGVAVIGGVIGLVQPHKTVKNVSSTPSAARPSYCDGSAATERLVECGWTPEQQRAIDQREASKRADQEAFVRQLIDQAKAQCDRPIGTMTPQDIEDCQRPGNRWLRQQQ